MIVLIIRLTKNITITMLKSKIIKSYFILNSYEVLIIFDRIFIKQYNFFMYDTGI